MIDKFMKNKAVRKDFFFFRFDGPSPASLPRPGMFLLSVIESMLFISLGL